jgi:hypothetical protein
MRRLHSPESLLSQCINVALFSGLLLRWKCAISSSHGHEAAPPRSGSVSASLTPPGCFHSKGISGRVSHSSPPVQRFLTITTAAISFGSLDLSGFFISAAEPFDSGHPTCRERLPSALPFVIVSSGSLCRQSRLTAQLAVAGRTGLVISTASATYISEHRSEPISPPLPYNTSEANFHQQEDLPSTRRAFVSKTSFHQPTPFSLPSCHLTIRPHLT